MSHKKHPGDVMRVKHMHDGVREVIAYSYEKDAYLARWDGRRKNGDIITVAATDWAYSLEEVENFRSVALVELKELCS